MKNVVGGQGATPEQAKPRLAAPKSAFSELGFKASIDLHVGEIQELYLADEVPWILGYSGGKDSTATLQLVWQAISGIPQDRRKKPIHVISTDTLVENPIVAAWVAKSLQVMRAASQQQLLPIQPNRLTPTTTDSFWVNLIGRGYPAPRHKFRWCTSRLKINPSNAFIQGVVSSSGEAILVLGTRKAESATRAANMNRHEKGRVRDRVSPSSSLPGTLIYSPIESWTNDDVWFYLMQSPNPWGYNNRDLLGMYAGASADGECPLVVDTSTPSCGDSRFGCWVCTLVEQDKSMTAMIQNDIEKEWMMPLLELRNALDFRSNNAGGAGGADADRPLRDFRRMSGAVHVMEDGREIPGPYIQSAREDWLRRLLAAQIHIRTTGPDSVRDLELISTEELAEIRRIWVMDKHEIEDSLPGIYREVTGTSFSDDALNDDTVLGREEMEMLSEICGEDKLHYELTRSLLSITRQQRSMGRRAGLFDHLETAFKRGFYDDRNDALSRATKLKNDREASGTVIREPDSELEA